MEKAIFAAGCFWGVEKSFKKIPGVVSTRVGYCGGHTSSPTYKEVCTGTTGHAESVEVTFDPEVIDFEKLIEFFWELHNPTTANRQGPDIGSQYRSAIFTLSNEQKDVALECKEEKDQSGDFSSPITTEISEAGTFWVAEDYHQNYYG